MQTENKKRLLRWALIALVTLGLQYLMMALSVLLIEGGFSFSAFGRMIHDRLTQPGDAVRYLDIAENGYVKTGENAINLVFYPLYPYLIRFVGWVTGSLPAAGLIISQVSCAGASILLYELLRMDRGDEDAWHGVLLMTLYPFSMFTMGVYTESLFLLLTIGCLYALRKRCAIAVGITGFLAALCRTHGFLLFIPAAYEWIIRRLGKEKKKTEWKDALILLIPLGFCVYLAINYALHGNCFQFLIYEADEPWFQTSEWIGRNISLQYSLGGEFKGLEWIIYYLQVALYFLSLGVLFLGLWKKERVAEVLYGGAYLGFTYLSGWMISGGRYLLGCVPVFIILSGVGNRTVRKLLILSFALIGFGYHLLFYYGFSIM